MRGAGAYHRPYNYHQILAILASDQLSDCHAVLLWWASQIVRRLSLDKTADIHSNYSGVRKRGSSSLAEDIHFPAVGWRKFAVCQEDYGLPVLLGHQKLVLITLVLEYCPELWISFPKESCVAQVCWLTGIGHFGERFAITYLSMKIKCSPWRKKLNLFLQIGGRSGISI